ncbi:hypothetical protein ACFY2W_36280 [Streptomyces sp. NPDC001262]|uniref:hypothetical protein n=1 Tax=Streptomyces sp. NPDC001262 TaxID=3364552 RepID=UPI0036ABB6EA
MTTASPQPHRERQPLGRPLSTLIPQTAPVSAAEQAMASLAALQTIPVHVGVLQAAVTLLEETARSAGEEADREAAAATAALLRSAMAPLSDG